MDDLQKKDQKSKVQDLQQKGSDQLISKIEEYKPYIFILWQSRWRIVISNFLAAVIIAALLYIFADPYYDSTVTILPDYGNKSIMGSFRELASLAGVSVGEATPAEIYQNLITSESVLQPVIESKYLTEEYQDSVNLIQYFQIEPDDDLEESLQKRKMFLVCYKDLTKSRIKTDLSNITKILDLKVTMPESKLSTDVANKVVESLDNYIRTKRKSNASNQRFYVEKRLDQIIDSLERAENLLKSFKEENRVISQSPSLLLEQTRLLRDVEILQTVYIQLTQQLEIIKIDEIRDSPILNIKEFAQDPVIKTGPRRLILFIFFMSVFFLGNATYTLFQKNISEYYRIIRNALQPS